MEEGEALGNQMGTAYVNNERFECNDECFFVLAPCCAREGLQNVESLGGSCDECLDVWSECEVGVKGDSEDTGCAVEG